MIGILPPVDPVHRGEAGGGGAEQRLAGEAARRGAVRAFQGRRPRHRGVADDEAVDAGRERDLGDVAHLALVEIGADLDQQRRLVRGRAGAPRIAHAGEQFLDLGARLQRPQPGRVRRGDVDDEIIREIGHRLDAGDVIGGAVVGVAVLADIGADDAGGARVACGACARRFASRPANGAMPQLLKPNRLMTASSSASRNSRWPELPGCGRGVTVPASTNPKPSASMASQTSACLSKPAARPTGLGKSRPHTEVARIGSSGLARRAGRGRA